MDDVGDSEGERPWGSAGDDPEAAQCIDLEQLGRQRPANFSTGASEVLFCFSLLTSMLMAEYFIGGFNVVLPNLTTELHIPESSVTWPASAFSLVTGSFLLPMGRVADMYGAYLVFMSGLVWFLIWSLVAGLSQNYHMMIAVRSLAGLGPAAFLPAGIMLLGKTYRPGPRKNVVFSLYGAFAPLGFFFGIIMGGITCEYLSWRWYFYLGTIVLFVVCVTSLITIPMDRAWTRAKDVQMDHWGLATIVPGLTLVVFAITDGGHAPHGWRTPYIIITFVAGVLLLAAAIYVEGWIASQPLLPPELFRPKYMKPLVISLFFTYGAFGIFLFYASFYIENVTNASAIETAVSFTPMAVGGIILATVGGFVLHLLPGRALMIISGLGSVACVLLFALMPEDPNYWAWVFPAMIGATIGVDITWNVTSIFITTNVPRSMQGVAGALINSLLFLGISFFLGLADLAVTETQDRGTRGSYQVAFWLGTGCAGFALLLFTYIRIGKAKSELLVEERDGQQAPEMGQVSGAS
ncbi:MFS general substrate transporter [Pleurostoma richardsiae]|uniref:MFS general substrate transporter n=1 Tax=Pleurostoma richardsiae TaxID=41990 RepID=A0AA38RTR1_9PEZI|nr:MFS general substrate transporter [Pleurostoma richardsiae]